MNGSSHAGTAWTVKNMWQYNVVEQYNMARGVPRSDIQNETKGLTLTSRETR